MHTNRIERKEESIFKLYCPVDDDGGFYLPKSIAEKMQTVEYLIEEEICDDDYDIGMVYGIQELLSVPVGNLIAKAEFLLDSIIAEHSGESKSFIEEATDIEPTYEDEDISDEELEKEFESNVRKKLSGTCEHEQCD